LARRITHVFGHEELTLVAVLTGALVFLADLLRHLPLRTRVEVVSLSSYPGPAVRSQGVSFRLKPPEDLAGRNVLILDDILDTGQTLACLLEHVRAQRPASLRSCVLLRKRRTDLAGRVEPDWVGFEVPDDFVVGYGLDHDGLYRNLPDIRALERRRAVGGDP
jgi:hypoxanthine phosphoribosyltransferase